MGSQLLFEILTVVLVICSISQAKSVDAAVNQCGGVLEASPSEIRTLDYKYDTPVDRYESCIWTIHAANRSLIKINYSHNYYIHTATHRNLSVGYFNKSNYDDLEFFTWTQLPHVLEPITLEVPGPVVFIYFVYIHDHQSLGFRLTYTAGGEEQSSIYNFDNIFLEGEYGRFEYPPNGGKYGNNQRTTLVVKPYTSAPSGSSVRRTEFSIINKGIEETTNCSVDNLNIYGYGVTGGRWYKNATICGTNWTTKSAFSDYPRHDPLIITFKSDESDAGDGFELFWRNESY